LKFGKKLSSMFFEKSVKKSPSRSVRKACRKPPGGHRRVFSADGG